MKETQLNGESLNIVTDNIEKMKQLFPEIITEDKIDFNKLKEILGKKVEESDERYQFTWPGKNNMVNNMNKHSNGTLRPLLGESKAWDNTQNLYIEGDNVEVLKLLQKSYYNLVDTIYIDPPYNTGNDILYKNNYFNNLDNYLEFSGQSKKNGDLTFKLTNNTESNGRFHSDWLNIIYSPIKLGRNLLSDTGCMYITIDHYELNNLINICNEIFGENNRVGLFTVVHNPEGRQNAKFLTYTNEYVLIYAKNIDNFKFNKVVLQENKKESQDLSKIYPYKDGNVLYKLDSFIRLAGGNASLRKNKPSCWYPIYVSKDLKHISTEFHEGYSEVYPITKRGQERTWKLIKSSTENKIKNHTLIAINENNQVKLVEKYGTDRGSPITTVWINSKYNSKKYGTKIIEDLFGKKLFDFPKSLYAVNDVLSLNDNENNLVLDFFSGSATTAHAVMEKNSIDNGHRNFIMIQLPQKTSKSSTAYKENYKNICEIGKERIRRAGEKLLKTSDNDNLDVGFKVFKLDSSNLTKWNPDYDNLEDSLISSEDNIISGRSELDLVYEIMLKYGINLSVPVEETEVAGKKMFNVGFGALFVCLDDNLTVNIADELVDLINDSDSSVTRVVFKDNGFASDSDKANVKETLRANNVDEFITI